MKNILLKVLLKKARNYPGTGKRFNLVIYDDIYPHPVSGFRMEEFTSLLEAIPNSKIVTSGEAYQLFNLPDGLHDVHISSLIRSSPALEGRIEKARFAGKTASQLFYCVFLHNMYKNIDWVEKMQIPFVFTLYPGGGFCIGDAETENRLRRIFQSLFFRKVIVTQKTTYDYLVRECLCEKSDICFVFGVVVPQESMVPGATVKKKFPSDKAVFDVCFCAAKYTEKGEDKGYPLFTDLIKAMTVKYDFLRFHVIGGFDKDVIDVSEAGDKVKFYGYQGFSQLRAIFRDMDLIISPNQPGKLKKGAFDGFPLGIVIEAAFNGVAVMLTDCLLENRYFEDGQELVVVLPELDDIIEKFEQLIKQPEYVYEVAERGRKRFQYIYSNAYQLTPRLQLLKSLINDEN